MSEPPGASFQNHAPRRCELRLLRAAFKEAKALLLACCFVLCAEQKNRTNKEQIKRTHKDVLTCYRSRKRREALALESCSISTRYFGSPLLPKQMANVHVLLGAKPAGQWVVIAVRQQNLTIPGSTNNTAKNKRHKTKEGQTTKKKGKT